jgi:hypothetical protein
MRTTNGESTVNTIKAKLAVGQLINNPEKEITE